MEVVNSKLKGYAHALEDWNWNTVGHNLQKDMVSAFLNEGDDLLNFNATCISLIPKDNNDPKNVTEFRQIRLCNVFYKIIAKFITNRMKRILPSVILECQCTIVPGRIISDNTIVAFETFT